MNLLQHAFRLKVAFVYASKTGPIRAFAQVGMQRFWRAIAVAVNDRAGDIRMFCVVLR